MGFEDKDHDDHENSDHGKALTITLAATMFLVGVVLLLLLLYFYAQHLLKRQQIVVVGVSVTSRDADRSELENVGCSGLRIASFSSIVIGRERSRKNQSSDHGSDSNVEDVEKQ